jgi:hypothetical protein
VSSFTRPLLKTQRGKISRGKINPVSKAPSIQAAKRTARNGDKRVPFDTEGERRKKKKKKTRMHVIVLTIRKARPSPRRVPDPAPS